jgi:hypothetical protein
MRNKRTVSLAVLIILTVALVLSASAPWAGAQPTERIEKEVLTRRVLVYPTSSMYPGIIVDASGSASLLDMGLSGVSAFSVGNTGNTTITGAGDNVQLTVTGNSTQTSDLFVAENSAGTDRVTVNNVGRTDINFARDATTGYDYGLVVDGQQTGVLGGAKTRAVSISLERPAGSEAQSGDIEDLGLMVRADTHAVTTTTGAYVRGIDVEAKADNPSGTATGIYGGAITGKSDTGAGDVGTMIALQTNVQNNAAVDDYLVSLDARIMRQAATEPTEEYIVHLRQGNTSGTGVDAGIYIESDASGEMDDFNYGIDMSAAEIDNADIRLQNGGTILETTDQVVAVGEYLGLQEGTVETIGAGETIDPTGTYHPITASGSVSTSADGIAVGTYTGQLLLLVMEGAGDVTVDGTGGNVECKANVALDTGDTLLLIWDGADWRCISNYDNS